MVVNIFHCYRSLRSKYFSIIPLLQKNFQGKKPKLFKFNIISTGSNDFTNLCLFKLRCIFKTQWRSTPFCNFMAKVLIIFFSNLSS